MSVKVPLTSWGRILRKQDMKTAAPSEPALLFLLLETQRNMFDYTLTHWHWAELATASSANSAQKWYRQFRSVMMFLLWSPVLHWIAQYSLSPQASWAFWENSVPKNLFLKRNTSAFFGPFWAGVTGSLNPGPFVLESWFAWLEHSTPLHLGFKLLWSGTALVNLTTGNEGLVLGRCSAQILFTLYSAL